MRGHRAAAHRHQVNSLAAECEWQRSGAVDVAYDEHSVYSAQACKSLSVHRTLSARLLQKKEDVPRIAICNLPMLGNAASSLIRSLVAHIAQELAQAPSVTMYVVIPPNQAESGAGRDRKVKALFTLMSVTFDLWLLVSDVAENLQAQNVFETEGNPWACALHATG